MLCSACWEQRNNLFWSWAFFRVGPISFFFLSLVESWAFLLGIKEINLFYKILNDISKAIYNIDSVISHTLLTDLY